MANHIGSRDFPRALVDVGQLGRVREQALRLVGDRAHGLLRRHEPCRVLRARRQGRHRRRRRASPARSRRHASHRSAGHRAPSRSGASLPPRARPFCASRNAPASRARSAASSGSLSGGGHERGGVLGDPLAEQSRADSRTRPRAGSPPAAPRAATSSTSCLLPCATVAEPLATSMRRCWLSSKLSRRSTSIRSHRALMPCSSGGAHRRRTASSVTPLIVPPRCSASRSALKRSRVSFTASNATGRPCSASVELLREPLRKHLHLGRRRRRRRAPALPSARRTT